MDLGQCRCGQRRRLGDQIRQREKTWARRSKNYAMTQLGNFLANALDHGAVVKIALLVRNDTSYGA